MIISHKYKFIFIKTRKTAGTSIEVFLSQLCGEEDIVTPIFPYVDPHISRNYKGVYNPLPELISNNKQGVKAIVKRIIKREKFYNHISAKLIKQRIPTNIWNDYFKFGVERNPWEKTLSHYYMVRDRIDKRMTLEQYFERKEFCHNHHLYLDDQDNLLLNRILKFENLNSELDEVFKILGIPFDGELRVKAKGNHSREKKNYREVYTTTQKNELEKTFRKEILLHGYEF